MVALAQGPNQFQEEFNKITRELVGDNEELYQRVQNELAADVKEMKMAAEQLANANEGGSSTNPDLSFATPKFILPGPLALPLSPISITFKLFAFYLRMFAKIFYII